MFCNNCFLRHESADLATVALLRAAPRTRDPPLCPAASSWRYLMAKDSIMLSGRSFYPLAV